MLLKNIYVLYYFNKKTSAVKSISRDSSHLIKVFVYIIYVNNLCVCIYIIIFTYIIYIIYLYTYIYTCVYMCVFVYKRTLPF